MIKLVIFDVDGVILDSETMYVNAAVETCRKYHYDLPVEIIKKSIGCRTDVQKKIDTEYMGEDFDFDTYFVQLKQEMERRMIEDPPSAKKGLVELLDYLKKKGISIALATSSDRKKQNYCLKKAGVYDYFDYMIFGEDIKNSKPDPEIYLKVIEHFGCDKDEVLIIEDSVNGILSGYNAGARVIYVPDIVEVPQDIVDRTFRKLDDLSQCIELIEELDG